MILITNQREIHKIYKNTREENVFAGLSRYSNRGRERERKRKRDRWRSHCYREPIVDSRIMDGRDVWKDRSF